MTLRVWVPPEFALDEDGDVYRDIIGEFDTAHPGLEVHLSVKQAQGKGGMLDLLLGANQVAPNYVPDLVLMYDGELLEGASAGLVQDMASVNLPDLATNLFPSLVSFGTLDTSRFGAPFGVDFVHLAYSSAVTTTIPITWGVVTRTAAPYAFASGVREYYYCDAVLLQYLGAGGQFAIDQGRLSLDADVLTRVLANYAEVQGQGAVSTDVLTIASPDEAWDLLVSGDAGFAEVWASDYMANSSPTKGVAFSAVPTLSGNTVSLAHGWDWAISARTPERQEAAAEFLAWTLDPRRAQAWTEAAHLTSPDRMAWPQAASRSPYQALAVSLLQASRRFPPQLASAEAVAVLHQALSKVLTGDVSPAQAAQSAVAQLKALPR